MDIINSIIPLKNNQINLDMPSCIYPHEIYTKIQRTPHAITFWYFPWSWGFRSHPGFRWSQDLQVTMPWKALVLSFALNCRRSRVGIEKKGRLHGISMKSLGDASYLTYFIIQNRVEYGSSASKDKSFHFVGRCKGSYRVRSVLDLPF